MSHLSAMFPHIENAEVALRNARLIRCMGLDETTVPRVLLDERYWLEAAPLKHDLLFLCATSAEEPPHSVVSFYADCLAFEHEMVTLPLARTDSIADSDVPLPFKQMPENPELPGNHLANRYIDTIHEGIDAASRLTVGWIEAVPVFQHGSEAASVTQGDTNIVELNWDRKYGDLETAVHLYAAALRQVDPFARYLCYYRVIENLSNGNGKDAITSLIKGEMECSQSIWWRMPNDISNNYKLLFDEQSLCHVRKERLFRTGAHNELINIVEGMRSLAFGRLAALRKTMDFSDITERLYNTNRCGIAHGKEIVKGDFGDDWLSILNDLKLIAMLARVAIDRKLSQTEGP